MLKSIKNDTNVFHTWLCEVVCSYLTSLLLPKDSRLRVSFGFTREGGSAALSHNLVPWADDKLGCSWSQRAKAPVLVDQWYTVRPNIRARDYQGLGISSKNKQYTTWSNQNGSAVQSFHAALYPSLSNGSEQREDTNDYHCHGNQVGHSSRWG